MRFIESEFRQLVEETEKTVMRLGTTSHAVLNRHRRFAEMLVAHLQEADLTFDLAQCLEWAKSLEHDPASAMSSSYVDWIALHRFIHLLAEQQTGSLSEWRHYQSFIPEQPSTEEYISILTGYQERLKSEGKVATTVQFLNRSPSYKRLTERQSASIIVSVDTALTGGNTCEQNECPD